MPSRSTRLNTDLRRREAGRAGTVAALLLAFVCAPLLAAEPSKQIAERYASEIEYAVVTRGPDRPLPPVTVVAPSPPPPVHEVVVSPVDGVHIAGEDLVFAQIMQDEYNAGCKRSQDCGHLMEPDIGIPPGDSLTPDAPFGTRRNVIEL